MTTTDPGSDRDGPSSARQTATLAPATEPQLPERRFRTFDSLIDVPAFRWYMLSQVGNQGAQLMQMVVRGFLAYTLTNSFAALGFVELAAAVPRVFLALYGGVVADRASRRVIIQVGQALNAALAVVLAVLLFLGLLRFEHLVISAIVQGVMNSFVMPARQSMIPEIVGPHRLMNAFALNALGMNILRLGAPALAGGLIAAVGAGWVYTIMAGLFIFGMVTLFRVPKTTAAMRAATNGTPPPGAHGGHGGSSTGTAEILDALRYLRGQRVLVILLLLHCIIGILALPYQRLMPGFVDMVLSGGNHDATATIMGALLSFTAIGALGGSLVIASLPSRNRGMLLIGSLVIFAVGLLAFSASTTFWVSAGIVIVLGVGQAGRQSLVNILIQSNVSNEYRGRISSILVLEDGIESFGIFLIALLAEAVGPQLALGIVAVSLAALAGGIWSMKSMRTLQ